MFCKICFFATCISRLRKEALFKTEFFYLSRWLVYNLELCTAKDSKSAIGMSGMSNKYLNETEK